MVISHVPESIELINGAIKVALEECGLQATAYANLLCPVDTGLLKASIDYMVDGESVVIGDVQEYAPYVELGTSRTKAQPFLRPALADHLGEYQKIFEDEIGRALS